MTREEAIEVYNGLINQKIKEAFEFFAPELRESEDERIRKELKEAFEAYDIESKWNGIPIRSIFAWLEKQKEQKPSWSEEDETSIAVKNPEAYKIGFADGEAYAREQKEHWKPTEKQMTALENVIKCELSAGLHTRAEILAELYEHLKKL